MADAPESKAVDWADFLALIWSAQDVIECQFRCFIGRVNECYRLITTVELNTFLPVAEWYASGPLSMLELIQEGNCGLMRALDKFPEARLDNFVAYATFTSRASSPTP